MPAAVNATDRAGTPDLQIQAVRKRYGAFAAVDDLSFEVRQGSFFSILGPSGCGKTTLLRMIAGFIAPDAGDLRIKGVSMNGVPPNRRPVNMVFQHLALFPMMNVGENIAYGLERRGVKGATAKAKVTDMLRRVGLPGSEGKRIDQLSGGQKQRVAIARSLVLEPALLLLDEPLGALDLKLREHMKVELKQLQAEVGTTFVYITHDQSEALVMSDQVAVMNHGRFEQLGTPQQLYYQPQTAFVAGFVGNNNRFEGTIESRSGEQVLLRTPSGMGLWSQRVGQVDVGQQALLFIRPEAIEIGRSARELPAGEPAWTAKVQSVLFDGGNSTVQVREDKSDTALQIALPLTGRLADLKTGETVHFGYQPAQAWCFSA
ncbi:ABC transporter ATP-binding protein [Hydrogenophaga sp. A37]|uniref:ABC transporter ATP-binding protein n=1 Tax=Hydrogenophaga sp. A37 TaxID=1945864 RepID=UPI000987B478|nr:ABC transporter ATP-binding protein [Hydrogenophaga sp. A37]OOG83806.1 spermidine/putrescine ABC transporter ATP-binding protein [Hydrogenophaga sp. A37]